MGEGGLRSVTVGPFVTKKKKKLLSMWNTDRANILFMSPCILHLMAPFVKRLWCGASKGGCGAAAQGTERQQTARSLTVCRRRRHLATSAQAD